jgi:hypothetical protein
MPTLDSDPRHAPQKPSRRAHDGLPKTSPRPCGVVPVYTNDSGSPSTAVVQDSGSARRVLSTQHPRGPFSEACSVRRRGPDSEKGDAATRTSFRRKRLRAIHRGVPGTLVPSHLPKTCPWAPGYLEAWLLFLVYIDELRRVSTYLPTPAAVLCPLVPTLHALVATRM